MKLLSKISFVLILILSASAVCFSQSNSYEGVTFSFKLTDAKSEEESKSKFCVGEEIVIETSITNNSNAPFPFRTTDEFYLYRFSLTKTGEGLPVSYRSDRARILSIREEERGGGSRLTLDPILPGAAQKLATMKLSERYENPEPGSYTLWIEYKTGKIIQVNEAKEELRLSHEISFEIVR